MLLFVLNMFFLFFFFSFLDVIFWGLGVHGWLAAGKAKGVYSVGFKIWFWCWELELRWVNVEMVLVGALNVKLDVPGDRAGYLGCSGGNTTGTQTRFMGRDHL